MIRIRVGTPLRFLVVVSLLSLGALSSVHSQPLVTIRSGHRAPITAFRVHQETGNLFTIGDDGNLKVWAPSRDRLLQTIRADRLPLKAIALFPDNEHVAVYATDGRREHRISVWNWITGERLYLHTPDEEVLWMDVSPHGSYLVYSVPDLRSIRLLDAFTGRQLPFLRQTTGIVNWFVVAASEERVMTYTPSSGAIVYRNVVTGTSAGSFNAPPNLTHFTLLGQRRYAAVRTEEGFLGILDLLSGNIVTELPAGEIEAIQKEPGGDDILVFTRSMAGERTIRRFRFSDGRLQQRFETRRTIPADTMIVFSRGREVFGGDRNGRLLHWAAFETEPVVFAESITDAVRDLYFSENRLFLVTADQMISVSSDFFRDMRSAREGTTYVDQRVSPISAGAGTRFLPTGGGEVLLWTPERPDSPLHSFNRFSGQDSPIPVAVPPGTVSLTAWGDELVILTRAGLLQLLNYTTGEEVMRYRGSGFQTAIRTERDIFLGKAYEGGVLDSAILRIDPGTGQTVPMDTESRLVFSLSYDPQRGRLFALGVVAGRDGNLNTVIEVFDGPNYSRRRTILEVPGERLDAHVVIDPSRGIVYTTLDDRGGILRWDGVRVSELSRNTAHIPRRLILSGDYVYSVNWDGTVSLIDRFQGSAVVDIAVIDSSDNGQWVALRPDGRFFVSRENLANQTVFSINSDEHSVRDLVFDAAPAPTIPTTLPGRSPTPLLRDRFDTGRTRDPQIQRDLEEYDPEEGAPAPSS